MKHNGIEKKRLYLKEETNALDYLERAARFIRETESDVKSWKWVMIVLHGALYGFAISACQGSYSDNVKTKRGKLIGFWDALKMCQDPLWMKRYTQSQHLTLTPEQEQSVKLMKNLFRNNFEHFSPKDWSIELHGISQVSIDVLEVIRFLALETRTYAFYLNEEEKNLVDRLVSESISFLRETEL